VSRRAVFIDVENTSSEDTLMEVIESLKIDRATQPTELTAVGNWRAVGQRMARTLAGLGAQLMHSAPALGVRDWSDLWIAVAAGCWLGQAAPGDVLEIVSNDRAFDAVGDAAAARGVVYHRLLHRRGATAPVHAAAEAKAPSARRSRGGRRRRRSYPGAAPPAPAVAARTGHAPAPPHVAAPARAAQPPIEAHGATREQMLAVIGRLGGDAAKWVNLDILEKALKSEGFARPPGSPRLVTRLRALKEVEIDSHGRVRLTPGAVPAAPHSQSAPPATETSEEPRDAVAPSDEAPTKPAPKRRRRRRTAKPAATSSSPPEAHDAPE